MYNLRTRPISRRLFSGKFKDPLTTRYKTFKNRLNSKVLCFMLKVRVFFKNCKI